MVSAGVGLGLLAGATIVPLGSPGAMAAPIDQPPPSRSDIERAEARADQKAAGVPAMEAALAQARDRADAAALSAAQAAEAFNGARYHLAQAREEARAAVRRADEAARSVEAQRDGIAAMVTATYTSGGDLQSVHAFLGTSSPEDLMAELVAVSGATDSAEATYQRFQVDSQLADSFAGEAAAAREAQEVATREASARRDEAAAAAGAAAQAEAAISAQRDALIAEVARAEGISIALAEERQRAIEARQEARRAAEAAQPPAEPAPEPDPQPAPDPAPAPDPDPTPAPDPAPNPPAAGGAAKAIAFAKAQLGEPYRWGAAGPDAWDCSGLMLGAWGAAGVDLPHWSVAQFTTNTAISESQLRPGDLVFWSTSSSPDGIHHVAMYLGNGQMIHAPRTGRPVTIESMYYWKAPTHFARVG